MIVILIQSERPAFNVVILSGVGWFFENHPA